MLVLSVLIGLMLWGGDRTRPYVRDFNWHNKQIGAADTFFVLTFSRPMNHASVEANLKIEPPLPGLISWSGKRLVYTLTNPAPYETTYNVQLQKARQKLGTKDSGNLMTPFVSQFRSRDRTFAFIGIEGEEKGRLILYNLTRNQKTFLTPKNSVVTDFKPYPTGDRILFSASDWSHYGPGLFEQQLYTVTLGQSLVSATPLNSNQKAGTIERILDNLDYQNMKFDLSPNGQVIVVQRVNRSNVDEAGLWILRPGASWQPLLKQAGGEFLFTPDSAALANTQGEGVAILPLLPEAKPLDFLPKFSKVLSFDRDGIRAAMVKLNTDSTQSLYLVTNQGLQKELLSTKGEFLNCQFGPRAQTLYCLVTRLLPGEEYIEQPYLEAIDLNTFKVETLVDLPNQFVLQMSLSPDGSALLFDELTKKGTLPSKDDLTTDIGAAIATSRLWLLPLVNKTPQSTTRLRPYQELPLRGFHPQWLP